jgi:UDP-glucose 4-epimerase
MVILVTGGCGYIGSKLIRDLATDEKLAGSTIRILDNMLRERYVSLMDLPKGDFEFLEGDIRKEDDLEKAFRDVDAVIDLAGITNAPISFERKELTFEVNVGGGKKVVERALKQGVERFVYSSTASVYGPTNGVVDEKGVCKPISPYGESKLQAERFCIEASKTRGLDSTVLRLGTVYGYSIGMRFDTVVDRFVYLACAGAPLTVWESAQREKRPYLHLQDSCNALIHALKRSDMKGETYNVVGENASISRITAAITKEIPDVNVLVTPTPNLNQVSYELDSSKIAKMGFRPQHNLEDGVKEMVQKFRGLLRKHPHPMTVKPVRRTASAVADTGEA